ncbi:MULTISPECIES: class I SAM-dependent methyltransferase [Streptosporangium]|uniref:NDP-4-keto-2,6-dideoxyhexose 3-C-methyltransferase n=1 Tax=Streptosporangium brasiliense TaxID=47480 RepID=A0ABT9R308_9ACTN|nr:class I SAM-dependent methyltransferase [Streptosporangium brasiliense]MDP9863621.1 NDP-4-keto-2,6-dideoxyhexose 3-C-methyltransferase [Streptosporangium brasiliense]
MTVIDRCRICDNTELLPVLDLGPQALTGVFPRTRDEPVPQVPLELVVCSPSGCGLVQLRHTADFGLMYGEHYGYRSSLNRSMADHLRGKVAAIRDLVDLGPGDLVVDIGSNDGTLLSAYPADGPTLVGVDPAAAAFAEFYPPHVELIPDFFARDLLGGRRAKVVTSIAMFYDLPRPMDFMEEVRDLLTDDGIWVIEQSYLPAMLHSTAYDVVCHEHLDYYALRQIEWMAERTGLMVVHAELNAVYGGSLSVVLARNTAGRGADGPALARIRAGEEDLPYAAFARRTREHRDRLLDFLDESRKQDLLTLGYGASTKGNVILQYCGLGEADLPCIAEVNQDKFGCYTPGTGIPIVSEEEARARRPDQFLVLPWIYREPMIARERDFLRSGGKLVFPLPELEVV